MFQSVPGAFNLCRAVKRSSKRAYIVAQEETIIRDDYIRTVGHHHKLSQPRFETYFYECIMPSFTGGGEVC